MRHVEEIILTILADAPGVTQYVDDKLHILAIPQNTTFPAVLIGMSSEEQSNTKDGPSTVDSLTFDVSSISANPVEAKDIDYEIRSALDDYSGTVRGVTVDNIWAGNASASFDDELGVVVIQRSFNIRIWVSI